MTRPEVSVVIPTRDRYELLAAAGLPSALAQEDVAVEVLVVDDGSRDDTSRRLQELGDRRVRVLSHEHPRGVAAARNAGIAAAESPWIAFLDDDDLWSPRKLASQLEALRRAEASFAYCSVVVLTADGTPTEVMQAPAANLLAAQLLRWNSVPAGSSNVVAAAELLRRVGGFDEQLALLADWDLWIRLALTALPAACDDVLVGYVRHPGRMRLGGRAAVAELERLRDRHGPAGFHPDAGRFLSWVAGEHRRAGRRPPAVGVYARAAITYRQPRQLAHVAATILDWRGEGLRRLISRRREPAPAIAKPEWLRSR